MPNTSELLKPSLEQEWKETKSYDINRLFLVAFFGGTIPLMILGTRNAKWLNVSKKQIHLLIVLGIILTFIEMGTLVLFARGMISMDSHIFRYLLRAGSVLLYLAYRKMLNKPFQQHLVTNGIITKIFKPALLWILVCGLLELVLFVVIGVFFV